MDCLAKMPSFLEKDVQGNETRLSVPVVFYKNKWVAVVRRIGVFILSAVVVSLSVSSGGLYRVQSRNEPFVVSSSTADAGKADRPDNERLEEDSNSIEMLSLMENDLQDVVSHHALSKAYRVDVKETGPSEDDRDSMKMLLYMENDLQDVAKHFPFGGTSMIDVEEAKWLDTERSENGGIPVETGKFAGPPEAEKLTKTGPTALTVKLEETTNGCEEDCAAPSRSLEPVRSDIEDSQDLRKRLPKDFTIKPSYVPMYASTPGKLLSDGVQGDAFGLQMKSSIPGGLNSEAVIGQSAALSQTDRLFRDQKNQLMRFKAAGDAGFLRYGAEYRSVGPGYRPQPGASNYRLDQEGTESWVEHQFSSWFSVKGLHTEYANNVILDPNRPRTTTTLNGGGTTFTIPSGPSLSLLYMLGNAEKRKLNLPGQVQESMVQQYSATLSYWHEWWDVSLSSSMTSSRDKSALDQRMENVYHTLSLSVRPSDSAWINTSVSYGRDRYSWDGEKVTSPMLTVSMYWNSLFGLVDFSSYTSYMGMKSTAGYMDNTAIYSINSFLYDLGWIKKKRYLSLDIIHNSYNDNVYRYYSSNEDMVRLMYTYSAPLEVGTTF